MSDDLSLKIWKKQESHSNQATKTWTKKEYKWSCILTQEELHERTIYSVSWSKWNGLIATCSADKTIKIHKLIDNQDGTFNLKLVHLFVSAHDGFDINCVSWCRIESDANLLASCGDDELVRVWSV